MDPIDLPPSTDHRLAIRLKELDLELSKQRYQSQLLHARTVEIESQRAIKLKELELELRNKSLGRPTAADALGVSMPVPLPINASTPSPIPTLAERAQRAATSENTCKLRKQLPQFDNAHAANAHNTTKKETRCKENVFGCVVSICSVFLCLCCEHLYHLLGQYIIVGDFEFE